MFLLLGFAELAFLFADRQGYQNGVDVLALTAASEMAEKPNAEDWHAGWEAIVKDEAERVGCNGQPTVTLPDETHLPGDRVLIRWTCTYRPRLYRDFSMPITVESEAVVPGVRQPPEISPSPSTSDGLRPLGAVPVMA